MRYKIRITLFLLLLTTGIFAQQQQDKKPLRVVDTLTAQEKNNRNPIILKAELDSLIRQYNIAYPVIQLKEQEKEAKDNSSLYIYIGFIAVLLVLGTILFLFYTHQKKLNKEINNLNRQLQFLVSPTEPFRRGLYTNSPEIFPNMAKERATIKTKVSTVALEKKINDLNAELTRLTRENESLNRVVKEYNGIQHEYDSLRHGITKTYKVKNYPGYDKDKAETPVLQAVLDTESSVANYAYENFLKPILAITDANKNNPARISEEDSERLLNLLVSLSLLYTEYLYLRVNDLSIGGKMVERIQGLKNGNGLDPSLLKKLNMEHGSRALVLRMVLDKMSLHQLSYPVFDETDLNNQ